MNPWGIPEPRYYWFMCCIHSTAGVGGWAWEGPHVTEQSKGEGEDTHPRGGGGGWRRGRGTGLTCTSFCGRAKQLRPGSHFGNPAARRQTGDGTESPRLGIFKRVGQTDGVAPPEAEDALQLPRPLNPAVAFPARFSAGNEQSAPALPARLPRVGGSRTAKRHPRP